MVFEEYADFYDLYYENKDYGAEADFVLRLAGRFGGKIGTLLDMGCGTGRHIEMFLRRGVTCDGFDRSKHMLDKAACRLAGKPARLNLGDLTRYDGGRTYDVVVSMFAVMGYLVSNEDMVAGLKTARRHLREGGVFVFDGWFGPAVLAQQPEVRTHEHASGGVRVCRKAVPALDPVAQKVTVRFEVSVTRDGAEAKHFAEVHEMRMMFVQEMRLLMESAGLKLAYVCPFMEEDGTLSTATWNVCFVAVPA